MDTVFIADNILRLDLISFPGLEDLLDSPAYITAGLQELYLDEALYSAYNSPHSRPWKKDRLRFSVAHELGHIYLHRDLVPKIRCRRIEDLMQLFNAQGPERNTLEAEANEFAGRLIVPANKLKEALDTFAATQRNPRWRDFAEIRDRFCEMCSPLFGLHIDGIRARLDREEVWPTDWIR